MLLITPFSPEFDPVPVTYKDHKTGLQEAIDWLKEARHDQQELVIDVRRVFDGYMTAFVGSFGLDDIPALEELLDNCP